MTEGPHNPGQELDLAWLEEARINLPAVLRRAATYGTRRTVKQQWQAAWLLRAVTCIDLTTLAGDDTETNVARLCLKAARPVRKDLLQVTVGTVSGPDLRGAIWKYSPRKLFYDHNLGDNGKRLKGKFGKILKFNSI